MNPNSRNFNGFGLVEALVSLFIFAILLLGLNYSLIMSIEHNTATFLRNTATKIAQGYADKLRSDNSTVSTGGENECNPKDGTDKAIDNVPTRNSTIKFETVWNYNSLPNTQDKVYNLVIVTCYDYKGLKKVSYQTKIYKGKGGL
ncbi:MAG: prepilin-type N-terminal cleavage/methylation domain-containing protein [Calditerrivibrio sp.]|nr:prepilin-type N-terminal cleavage/methylation domain-containing protein [Calditerrivibrio sp.]